MIEFYKEHTTTKATMIFDDALNIDYSKLKYDMVLTSPPYYNKEIYGNIEQLYKSKKDWNENFYIPLFRKVFDGLSCGGNFCLNVPIEIYDKVLVPMFGECNTKISFKKVGRKSYEEFIYIWYKTK
jgi:DNA modification methylase